MNTVKNGRYTTFYASPLGMLQLASDGQALTGLWIQGQKYDAATLCEDATEAELPVWTQARKWLDAYFAGDQPDVGLPLAPCGSEFRQAVWKLLRAIPYGQVTTYGRLAGQLRQTLGKPVSAQAVGGAVGHNPISILIPCHRVVGTDGSLTGYAAGVDKKRWLLQREGVAMDKLYEPKDKRRCKE